MKAKRVYNNNVVLTTNRKGEEIVLIGRGVAYGLKAGMKIDESRIEKKFLLHGDANHKFQELTQEVSIDYILAAERMISHIKEVCEREISDSLYVTLTDHIVNMAERIRAGIDFDTAILNNLKTLYPAEYQAAAESLDILRKSLELKIPDSEALFVTLHIVNAMSQADMMETYTITKIIDEITHIVDDFFSLNKESQEYSRFLTHCRFFVQRIIKMEPFKGSKNHVYDEMYAILKHKCPRQNACVQTICDHIESRYHYTVVDEEKMYILVHLINLTDR